MNNSTKSRNPALNGPESRSSGSPEFLAELERFGPDGAESSAMSEAEARDYCRRLAISHYENFPVVSRLLPKRLHQHFYNIYAYCRWADDLGDEVGDTTRSLELLDWWEQELNRCYEGQGNHPVFVALRETIEQFEIPKQPFEDLITAFKQDQTVFEYANIEQLLDYCRNSANPVGRLVLYLCESVSDQNLILSDMICTGLQLANFWQDVSRDFDIGRVYLPIVDMLRFRVSRETIAGKVSTPEFKQLISYEVDFARHLLDSGLPLVERVPKDVRLDIELFIRGGLAILDAIESADFAVLEKRPKLSKWTFASLFIKCWFRVKFSSDSNLNRSESAESTQ